MTRKDQPDDYDRLYADAFNYGWTRAMDKHGEGHLDDVQLAIAEIEDEGKPSSLGDEGFLAALRSIEQRQIARMVQTYREMPLFVLEGVESRLLKQIERWNALIVANVGYRQEHQRQGEPWDLYWAEQLTGPIDRYRKEVARLCDRLSMVRNEMWTKTHG